MEDFQANKEIDEKTPKQKVNNKVTSTKPKNPGRVVWGKKLAQLNR